MTIGDLVKSRFNRLIITSIKSFTTTLNIIIANMVFTTLVNDLKLIYLINIKWNYVSRTHGLCQMGILIINGIDWLCYIIDYLIQKIWFMRWYLE